MVFVVQNISLSFRPVDIQNDLSFLASVYASTRLHEFESIDWGGKRVNDFLNMQFNIQHTYYRQTWPDAKYLIILHDGKKIGRLYKDYREDEIRIIDIALLNQYRRKGYGQIVMQGIIAEAAQSGRCVRIHVDKQSPAKRLYDRLGFARIGGTEIYDLMEWPRANSNDKTAV